MRVIQGCGDGFGPMKAKGLNAVDAGELAKQGLPPPRGWLLGNVFCRGFLSSIIAAGGVGKTALRYAQYLSLATGRPLTGEFVHVRSKTLIMSLEDDRLEMVRRLWAAILHYDINPKDLEGWLFLSAPSAVNGKLMMLDFKGRPMRGGLADNIEAEILEHRLDLIGIDPFVKAHSIEENSNSAIDDVVQILTDMMHKHNVAIDVPHHTSKGAADPGNANRSRGASAMVDAGRLIYSLSPMSPSEAEDMDIPEDERRSLVRMDSAKVNIAPPAIKARWFRLLSVSLGNGNERYPNGDTVQTVEPWTPPEVWASIDEETKARILSEIDAGLPNGRRYSAAGSASVRAAWNVVCEHASDKTPAQAREIIKTWVKAGTLVNWDYQDPVNRKSQNGLYLSNKDDPKCAQ